MAFTLDVTFGGLCLFVQRQTAGAEGLFVLMPVAGHHGPDEHIPTLRVKKDNLEHRLSQPLVIKLGNRQGGQQAPSLPMELAAVSAYAGGTPVNVLWLEGDPKKWGSCLAVRVEMPLESVVTSKGEYAKMAVTYGAPKKTHRVDVAGLATVSNIPIREPSITIDGIEIKPDSSGTLHIELLNVPKKDLHTTKRDEHEMCEVMHHFRAYYRLLSSTCVVPPSAPDLIVAEYVEERPHTKGVDPYRCTVGFGGPP